MLLKKCQNIPAPKRKTTSLGIEDVDEEKAIEAVENHSTAAKLLVIFPSMRTDLPLTLLATGP